MGEVDTADTRYCQDAPLQFALHHSYDVDDRGRIVVCLHFIELVTQVNRQGKRLTLSWFDQVERAIKPNVTQLCVVAPRISQRARDLGEPTSQPLDLVADLVDVLLFE